MRATSSGPGRVPSASRSRERKSSKARMASLRRPAASSVRSSSRCNPSSSGDAARRGSRSASAADVSPCARRDRARRRSRSLRSERAARSSSDARGVGPSSAPGSPRQSARAAVASLAARAGSPASSAARARSRRARARPRSVCSGGTARAYPPAVDSRMPSALAVRTRETRVCNAARSCRGGASSQRSSTSEGTLTEPRARTRETIRLLPRVPDGSASAPERSSTRTGPRTATRGCGRVEESTRRV